MHCMLPSCSWSCHWQRSVMPKCISASGVFAFAICAELHKLVSTERPDVVSDKVKSLLACTRAPRFCVDTCQSPSAYVPYYVSTWKLLYAGYIPVACHTKHQTEKTNKTNKPTGFLHYALHAASLYKPNTKEVFCFCSWPEVFPVLGHLLGKCEATVVRPLPCCCVLLCCELIGLLPPPDDNNTQYTIPWLLAKPPPRQEQHTMGYANTPPPLLRK